MNRKYEIMFILEVMEEAKTKEEVKSILTQHGGQVLKEEDFGFRNLAYKIKKREKGFYFLLEVELPPDKLKEINSDINLNEHILKYMCLIIDEKKQLRRLNKKKAEADARAASAETVEAPKVETPKTEDKKEIVKEPATPKAAEVIKETAKAEETVTAGQEDSSSS